MGVSDLRIAMDVQVEHDQLNLSPFRECIEGGGVRGSPARAVFAS